MLVILFGKQFRKLSKPYIEYLRINISIYIYSAYMAYIIYILHIQGYSIKFYFSASWPMWRPLFSTCCLSFLKKMLDVHTAFVTNFWFSIRIYKVGKTEQGRKKKKTKSKRKTIRNIIDIGTEMKERVGFKVSKRQKKERD